MLKPKTFFNPKLFLLILFSLILFFSFLTYWRFREFQKSLSEIKFPKFEAPKIETPFSPVKVEEKEFISPDGKLKLKYNSDWIKMENNPLLEFNKQLIDEAKMLFFAQKISGLNIGFLSVQEMEMASDQKLEEMVEKVKGGATTSETEIINLDIEDNEAVFEVDYKKEGLSIFHSKDKIIRNENKVYIVSILAFSEGWPSIEPEANQILDSTQILNP